MKPFLGQPNGEPANVGESQLIKWAKEGVKIKNRDAASDSSDEVMSYPEADNSQRSWSDEALKVREDFVYDSVTALPSDHSRSIWFERRMSQYSEYLDRDLFTKNSFFETSLEKELSNGLFERAISTETPAEEVLKIIDILIRRAQSAREQLLGRRDLVDLEMTQEEMDLHLIQEVEQLKRIEERRHEYFVKLKVAGFFRKPLEGDEHEELRQSVLDKYREDNFDEFRDKHYDYCLWLEADQIRQEIDRTEFRNLPIEPAYTEDDVLKLRGIGSRNPHRVFKEQCFYTQLTTNAVGIYTPDGQLRHVYSMGDEYQAQRAETKNRFGDLSLDQKRFFLNFFEVADAEEDFEGLLRLLQIYPHLDTQGAELVRTIFEETCDAFGTSLSVQEFKEKIAPDKEDLIEFIHAQYPIVKELIEHLRTNLYLQENENEKQQFGFKEDPDKLDFFLSFLEGRSESVHHSVCYYVFVRQFLPAELVQEFESEFGLSIPDQFNKDFSYDQYLQVPQEELSAIFSEQQGEIQTWLVPRIRNLYEAIMLEKPTFEEVTLKEELSKFLPSHMDKEQTYKNYLLMTNPVNREHLKSLFGIGIESLDLRAQVSVLSLLMKLPQGQINELANDMKYAFGTEEQKRNALVALLAHEQLDMSTLHFVDNFTWFAASPEVANTFFEKYGKLLTSLQTIEHFIEGSFSKQLHNDELLNIRERLIKKHAQMFDDLSSDFKFLGTLKTPFLRFDEDRPLSLQLRDINLLTRREVVIDEYSKKINEVLNRIEQKLQAVSEEQDLFLESFRSLVESGEPLTLEDINNSTFDVKRGGALSQDEVQQMKEIYSFNQSEVGAHEALVEGFLKRTADPATYFYIFKWQDKLQSFVAFTEEKNGHMHATSFNVNPGARGYKIGETMLQSAIEKEAEQHVLIAECYMHVPITRKYLETGWIAHGHFFEPGKDEGTIDRLFEIYRNDSESGIFWGKQSKVTSETIENYENVPPGVLIATAEEPQGLPLQMLQEGYVMTRMILSKKDKKYYGVFEQKPTTQQT
jgi:hypothetical protein